MLRRITAALASILALGSCLQREPAGLGVRAVPTTLLITADLFGSPVGTVVVEVTAPDIPSQLFNIPIVNHVASGTIALRAGSGRTITMRAYDAGGVETHTGSVTIDVQHGINATVSIMLMPLTGDVPIQATLGSFSVTVMPSATGVAVGATVPLTAVVKDWNGNPTTATVAWATYDPSIASVDASGLVSGMSAGITTIAATARGATGTATITVGP